jgi:hypothetical protein
MLGQIIDRLIDATTAEAVASSVAGPGILARIRAATEASAAPAGAVIAAKVRHIVEHGGDDIWLDLLSQMSSSPQPGAAAVERMLAHAFPDPVRVRITPSALVGTQASPGTSSH